MYSQERAQRHPDTRCRHVGTLVVEPEESYGLGYWARILSAAT